MVKTIIIIILSCGFVLDIVLSHLNQRTWTEKLPEDLEPFYDEEKYKKARAYSRDKYRFNLIHSVFGFLLVFIFFVAGGFGELNNSMIFYIPNHPIILALVYYGFLFLVTDLINIPFNLYDIFYIEDKYGFNRTKISTFIYDKLKSYLLTFILGGGIVSLLLWLINTLGNNFWIAGYVAVMIISLVINMFYGSLIIPLFNRLRPLDESELRTSIEELAKKTDFPLTNVYLMNGSKRSSKANAFFTGIWKKKKIVLYDTLITKHPNTEVVAVLAHEIGHYRKKHVVKNMIISAVTIFFMFYILRLFIHNPELSKAMGSEDMMIHINLIAFIILYQPISLILGLLGNYISRKQEFEADSFAVTLTGIKSLPAALKKLSVDHLSNLKPHPAYVFFYYSHPPLLKRLEAIEDLMP